MNLVYRHQHVADPEAVAYSKFPFQTPTELTWAVLSSTDKQVQKNIIFEYIDNVPWDEASKALVKNEIEVLLSSPYVTLSST